ncbi:MAG TPA: hypothetical protein VMU11_01715 [Verrucomicrobiae bacterium]|nr:hypothetical protein [Verrucomicrobiae bacterium]
MTRISYRQRKYQADMDAKRPRREPTPEAIFDGLQASPLFTVEHVMKPAWRTDLTFSLNGGPFADKQFGLEEARAFLSATLLTGDGEIPLEVIGVTVGYGACVVSIKYLVAVRKGFSGRRASAGLRLTFALGDEKRELRCSRS